MEFLTREALLAAATQSVRPFEIVECPELGGKVTVQGMSGTERDAWERSLVVGRGARRDINTDNVRARLAVRCIVDRPGGSRMFTDGDAATIGNLRADSLQKMFEACQRVNGVSDADVDELKKSSEMAAGSDSPTS